MAETTELKALLRPEQELPIGGFHDLGTILDELQRVDVLLIEQIMEIADTLHAARNVGVRRSQRGWFRQRASASYRK